MVLEYIDSRAGERALDRGRPMPAVMVAKHGVDSERRVEILQNGRDGRGFHEGSALHALNHIVSEQQDDAGLERVRPADDLLNLACANEGRARVEV